MEFISTWGETHLSKCLFESPFSQFKRLLCEQAVFLEGYGERQAITFYFGEFISTCPWIDFNTTGREIKKYFLLFSEHFRDNNIFENRFGLAFLSSSVLVSTKPIVVI